MLTTHPLLVLWLRKSRSYTSCHPNAPLWSVTGPLYLFLPFMAYIIKTRSHITWNASIVLTIFCLKCIPRFCQILGPVARLRLYGTESFLLFSLLHGHFLPQGSYFTVSVGLVEGILQPSGMLCRIISQKSADMQEMRSALTAWWWRKHACLKRRSASMRLHNTIFQKDVIFIITTMRPPKLCSS
jgi:hypothetical protein